MHHRYYSLFAVYSINVAAYFVNRFHEQSKQLFNCIRHIFVFVWGSSKRKSLFPLFHPYITNLLTGSFKFDTLTAIQQHFGYASGSDQCDDSEDFSSLKSFCFTSQSKFKICPAPNFDVFCSTFSRTYRNLPSWRLFADDSLNALQNCLHMFFRTSKS